MKARAIAAVALSLLLWATAGHAQSITATVGRTTVTPEDQILLEVTVEGGGNSQLVLPDLSDFSVHYVGDSQRVQIVNGQISQQVTHSYALSAKQLGNLVIGSVIIEIDGRPYESRPISIRVLPLSSRGPQDQTVFVRARVSNPRPYVGEQVIFTWRFFRRPGSAANAQLVTQDFGDLAVEDLGDVREFETTFQGQRYEVSEVRRALFASGPGTVVIPSWELRCQVVKPSRSGSRRRGGFDQFFARRETETRFLRTEEIELEVLALPPPPVDFSGLVGSFSVTSEVSKTSLELGESVTQKISVNGTGNAHMIPKVGAQVSQADFKVYDDQSTSQVERTASGLKGSRTFPRALVPLRSGLIVVPAVDLVYFDPEPGDYRRKTAPETQLEVAPSSSPEELRLTESLAPTGGKVAVQILADDLLPIRRDPGDLGRGVGARVRLGLLALPATLFLGYAIFATRRRRWADDEGQRRRRTALRRARTGFAAAAGDGEGLSRALRCFVGDWAGCEGAALTPLEARETIESLGAGEDLSAEVERVLLQLDGQRYGAVSAVGDGVTAAGLSDLAERLERRLSS